MSNELKAIMNLGQEFIAANLAECCREELEWQNTALLCDGKLREAAAIFSKIDAPHALPITQSEIAKQAMQAIAAPVASAAPSGELPTLPKFPDADYTLVSEWDVEQFWSAKTIVKMMQAYARAAIAHQPQQATDKPSVIKDLAITSESQQAGQPPKEALTDEQIDALAEIHVFEPDSGHFAPLLRNFARAIIAASAPNKQLVAALHELALLMSDTIRGEYEPDSFTLQPAVHALAKVGIEFPDDDYLLTKRQSCVVVPVEPTAGMIKAMAESRAVDDEGEYPLMLDLLDFSGENKTDTALRAAYAAALAAAGEVQS